MPMNFSLRHSVVEQHATFDENVTAKMGSVSVQNCTNCPNDQGGSKRETWREKLPPSSGIFVSGHRRIRHRARHLSHPG